ncbi:hypothetical protein HY621_01115 [Candidatus Uhrbacteria bacterium]|nr:hypothetical protein [Candidatus Uhrbacteria bacterium]
MALSDTSSTQAVSGTFYNYERDPNRNKLAVRFLLCSVLAIISLLFSIILSRGGIVYIIISFVLLVLAILSIVTAVIISFRETLRSDITYDERSGRGRNSEIPDELGKWNWGSAGLGYIWGVYFKKWNSFISLIPIINLPWSIFMGLRGNTWAWSNYRWESVAEFKRAQNEWKIWGIVFFLLRIPDMVIVLFLTLGVLAIGIQKLFGLIIF